MLVIALLMTCFIMCFFGRREKDGQFVEDLVLVRAKRASPNFGRWVFED